MLYLIARRVIDFINPPTAVELAMRELEDSRRELLHWEAVKEQADSMVPMLNARIKRLYAITSDAVVVKQPDVLADFGDHHAC